MIQTAHARAVMASLREAGVELLVISPGSRSTAAIAAAIAVGLRTRTVIDERSAAHLALGRARVSGTATAVLCTSGSAAACYLPAIVEATHARLPLVVITADRPTELQGCEAPQTIDQGHIYGDRVRHFVDLGTPSAEPDRLRATRRAIAQAVFASRFPEPGPVHINLPARKPLEPTAPTGAVAQALEQALALPLTRPHAPVPMASPEAIDAIARACSDLRRGVIACGPAPRAASRWRAAIAELSARTGYPVLAEATSQQRLHRDAQGCGSFDLLYATERFAAECTPELVIAIGTPPVSTAWSALLSRARPRRMAIASHGWADPQGDLETLCLGDVADAVTRIASAIDRPADQSWRQLLEGADRRAWSHVHAELESEPGDGAKMSEGQAVRAAVGALPAGALLAVGNSLPVRAVDTYLPVGSAEVEVLCQRGASGIDGVLSGAIGAATATDRPVLLLIGDVSFAHDIGALASARQLHAPLCIVVIDNGGGRIFERLPIARDPTLADAFEEVWLTPPRIDIPAAAAAFGLPAASAASAQQLARAIRGALLKPGATVLRAEVEAGSAEACRRRLLSALEAEPRLCSAAGPS